jgi:autotransporter-associated beta strand protein
MNRSRKIMVAGGMGRLGLMVFALLVGVQYASATTYTWTGGSTDFNRKQNYDTNATYSNAHLFRFTTTAGKAQPGLTADATIGSLQFTGSGWALSGNTNTLTLDSDNNFGSVAIDWSGTGGLNTINADLDFNNTGQYIKVGTNCSLTISGAIGNNSAWLTKTGGGTLTLSGTNTYTGTTNVSQGMLRLDGSLVSGSAVSLGALGTLSGTGTAYGAVTGASGSHLAPGNSIGTLNVGSLVISSGMNLDFEFGATNDYIKVINSGGLTLSGGIFNLTTTSGSLFSTNGTYNLMGYSGALGGSVSNLSVNDASKKYTFADTGSQIQLTIANLPTSWLTIPTSLTLRQMITGGGAMPGSLTVSNTASDAGGFTISGGSNVKLSANGGTVAASPGSLVLDFGWNDRTTPGSRSGTIILHNTANTSEPDQNASVIGAVIDNRSLLVLSTVSLGRIMRNQTTSAVTATLTSAASHNVAADVILHNGTFSTSSGLSGGVLSLTRVGDATFNGTTTAAQVSFTATFTAPGDRSGTASFAGSTSGMFDAEAGLAGQVLQSLAVPYTASVLDPRKVSQSGTVVYNVLLNGRYSALASLTTTGSDEECTRLSVALGSAADVNGIYANGGTGTLFNNALSGGTRLITGPAFSTHGTRTGTLLLSVTGEGLAGESGYTPVSVAYSLNVGDATADRSNSRSTFGSPLSAIVAAHSGSYANLESKVVYATGSAGGPQIGSTARILAGGNSTGSDATLLMQWRTRNRDETSTGEGGTSGPAAGPLPSWMTDETGNHGGLLSDVVDISGMAGAGSPGQTDLFVLEMNYTDALFIYSGDEESLRCRGMIFLGYLNAEGRWVNAVEGNIGANTTDSAFLNVNGAYNGTLVLGSWGVDTANNKVWAVLDHNSQFAALPEPATVALMLGGGAFAILVRRRKR